MTTIERLENDKNNALKSGDREVLSVIRMVIDAVQKKNQKMKDDAVKKGVEFVGMTEEDVISVIDTFKKQLIEEKGYAEQAGDNDKVAQLFDDIQVVETYLPTQLTAFQIKQLVRMVIDKTAKDARNIGNIMKEVAPLTKGKADGKLVNEVVRSFL